MGASENEGIDLVIDGLAVPRHPLRRTREDLLLLVRRTLALAPFVFLAWWRYPQLHRAMTAVALLGEAAVFHEFVRKRP
ncbi:MAG: hypothetical protein U0325_33665 [Polyangiales bacterium]